MSLRASERKNRCAGARLPAGSAEAHPYRQLGMQYGPREKCVITRSIPLYGFDPGKGLPSFEEIVRGCTQKIEVESLKSPSDSLHGKDFEALFRIVDPQA